MRRLYYLILALILVSGCVVHAQLTSGRKAPDQTINAAKFVDAIKVGIAEFTKEDLGGYQKFEIRIVSEKQLMETTFARRGNVRGGGLQITIDMDQDLVVKKIFLQ